MKIYIIVHNDRHGDTAVHPFADISKAVEEAKKVAKQYCGREEDYEELGCAPQDIIIFYARYSSEGDHVMVIQAEMDKEI